MAILVKEGFFLFLPSFDGIVLDTVPSIGGDAGLDFSTVVFNFSCALGPSFASDPSISLQLFPSGEVVTGTDVNGNIGANCTFVRDTPGGNIWSHTGPGANPVDLNPEGFLGTAFRVVINLSQELAPSARIRYNLQIASTDFDEYTIDPLRPIVDEPLGFDNLAYDVDEETGTVDITFSYTDPDADKPNGFIIEVSVDEVEWFPWGIVEFQEDVEDYVFPDWKYIDLVDLPETWFYRIYPYWIEDETLGEPTDPPMQVEFTTDLPDITVIGSGGTMDIGGTALIVFQGDPSGLYTLVPDKRNDTLYQRVGDEETEDVKIPNPFVKLGIT